MHGPMNVKGRQYWMPRVRGLHGPKSLRPRVLSDWLLQTTTWNIQNVWIILP